MGLRDDLLKKTLHAQQQARAYLINTVENTIARDGYRPRQELFTKLYPKWMGPGIARRTSKPGPTGSQFPNNMFVKNDVTEYITKQAKRRQKITHGLHNT